MLAAFVFLLMLAFSAAVALAALLRFRPIIAAIALLPLAVVAVCILAVIA